LRKEEVLILRERALDFLKTAKEKLNEGVYDLACFLSEQAAQLYLKSTVLELLGEVPRTRSISDLLHIIYENTKKEEIKELASRRRQALISLEDAYLMARYFARRYIKEEVIELIEVAEEVIKIAKHTVSCKKKG
jgi:HEPN domain-containing protein